MLWGLPKKIIPFARKGKCPIYPTPGKLNDAQNK
jgi:hypothetical protein